MKYTSENFVIGRSIKNFRGEDLIVRNINVTKDRKSVSVSDTKDKWYSFYFDDGQCIAPSMSERGYDIPYDFPVISNEVENGEDNTENELRDNGEH